jgi:hypothetical protein
MVWLRKNTPPAYDHRKTYRDNFDEFFHWALDLRNPLRQIPEIGNRLKFGVRRHPIGFIAVYLSPRDEGLRTIGNTGLARANIYPPGSKMKDDIHCHGFEFASGNAKGTLLNTLHYPDWSNKLPDGEGYVGYETSVDLFGQNHTVRATDAVVSIPRSETHVLQVGDTYSLRPRIDFHSVAAGEEGAVTIFCKTPTLSEQDGLTLVLKGPDDAEPPGTY